MTPDQHPPQTVVAVAGGVVDSFRSQPILLLIVILNAFFCGAVAYYLLAQERYRHEERMQLIRVCIDQRPGGYSGSAQP